MKRLLVGAVVLGAILLATPAVLMMMAITGGSLDVGGSCDQGGIILAGAVPGEDLDEQQRANASAIIDTGLRLRVPSEGILIALATARQESGFRNYANDGRGSDLARSQRRIAASLAIPHDAVGSDHGSLGVFQQQWPWWGSMAELMTPSVSAAKFYARLLRVPKWQAMTVAQAAQAVQQSAHPEAYADDVPVAYSMLTGEQAPSAETAASTLSVAGGSCTSVSPGSVAYPLPQGSSSDLHNYGQLGPMWGREHTGTDLSAPCGTPVLAATNGTVIISTDQPWSGNWLVEVTTGAGQLATWYGHMESLAVSDGQQVASGQQLGLVGDLGNASGCHLHFEVHPHGGGYSEDDVDPSAWLSANLGHSPAVPIADASTSTGIVLMTANILRTLGTRAATDRIHSLLAEGPDVLILQEVAHRDLAAIVGTAPGNWAVWQASPGSWLAETAIIWNADKFASIRKGTQLGYQGATYDRWIVWALLRSPSGFTLPVVGMHMPTNSLRDPVWRGYYETMTASYQRLLLQLTAAGYPPIIGSDWNGSLDRVKRSWGPVRSLERIGFTTNWLTGEACAGPTSVNGGHIDGFAFAPDRYRVLDQGCLDYGPSDHRPVWVAIGGIA